MAAKQIASKWRESASLIVLAKDKSLPQKALADYKVFDEIFNSFYCYIVVFPY